MSERQIVFVLIVSLLLLSVVVCWVGYDSGYRSGYHTAAENCSRKVEVK